jgi:hypothetical protein
MGIVVGLLVVGLTIGHLSIWDGQGGILPPLIGLLILIGVIAYVSWVDSAGADQALSATSWGDRGGLGQASSSGQERRR